MDEMIGYVFGSLRSSEGAVKSLKIAVAAQSRLNRKIGLFVAAAIAYAMIQQVQNYERDTKIEELCEDIKELKREKGE